MTIDEGQLAFVKGYLVGNGVSNHRLQDDLLDHFCCVIEKNMEDGKAFDLSFSEAVRKIAPDGPEEIQKDLNYLSTIKKTIMLRKLIFTSSYLSAFAILVGIALRIPQILSGNASLLLIMVGMLLFSVTTVPYFFYDRYQKTIRQLKSE
ncbi:MAG: hypothetical protein ABJP45_17105 [Cyclobacteriaceae bacterium]